MGRTILRTQFNADVRGAVLSVRSRKHSVINNVHLKEFTLLHTQFNKADTVDGILLEKVTHAELENLDLEKSGHRSLVLRQTQNIQVHYVALKTNSQVGRVNK